MLKIRRFVWCLLIAASYCSSPNAADTSGKYALRGAGFARCEHFLRVHRTEEKEWYIFYGWMDGYINGLNETVDNTFDAAPWQSTELLAEVLRRTCSEDPKQSFFAAVRGVIQALRDFRQVSGEDRMLIEVGEQTALIYPETMRQAQNSLARLGFYKGKANGKFGLDTQTALAAFQVDKGIPATGLPGPITLWALLVEEQP